MGVGTWDFGVGTSDLDLRFGSWDLGLGIWDLDLIFEIWRFGDLGFGGFGFEGIWDFGFDMLSIWGLGSNFEQFQTFKLSNVDLFSNYPTLKL